MKVLVAYSSKHGATEGIAHRIGETLTADGLDVEIADAAEVDDLAPYRAVVVGSAIYAGSWRKDAYRFVSVHEDELAARDVWLFSSGPLGDDVEDDEEEQPRQLDEIREAIAPRDHVIFAGAVDIEQLGFAERMVMKTVKAPTGDFRDWDAIESWARGIATALGEA